MVARSPMIHNRLLIYFLSEEDVDVVAAAGAAVAAGALSLLGFESLEDFESVLGFASLFAVPPSLEDLGLALP